MKIDIEPDQTKTLKADSRGRVCLGPEYKDREVAVIILDEE